MRQMHPSANQPSISSYKGWDAWRHLLSRNVRVGAGRRSSLWLAVRRHIQEIPDQNGVVVRTADDLKLVKLQAENTARVLH